MSSSTEIYAVDFDGTLCESKWPGIGAPNKKLIQHLIQCQKNGAKLILWTCRIDEKLQEAVDWCKKFGLEFDAVNDNLPENVERYGNNTRKIWATCYIDDLAADKDKWGLPFHTEEEIDYSRFDKYPLGSEWILRAEYAEIPVVIEEIDAFKGHITARSTSEDDKYRFFKVRRDIEWFYDKVFPLGEDTTDKAILVLDMPETCSKCKFMYEFYGIKKCHLLNTLANGGKAIIPQETLTIGRKDCCPLKKMPGREVKTVEES